MLTIYKHYQRSIENNKTETKNEALKLIQALHERVTNSDLQINAQNAFCKIHRLDIAHYPLLLL